MQKSKNDAATEFFDSIPKTLKVPDEKRILIVDDEPFNVLGM